MTAQPRQGQPHKPHADEPFTMDAVRLRHVNRWLAQGLGGELADLYVDSRETSLRHTAAAAAAARTS
ncbi:hypothetical protein [Streptomyces sp. SP17KL33]|uniref:hypothetical protein n=1 Tax=Streptomyces sp. SP17KL33 TaxID=3002534 RepID=UPI002E7A01B2|nr:hypothetical protein [Streptomyces sp. SP17KL33]MEE1830770.1 hypothetical protein [Streptomyces sp. SP17KL33]